jgi:nucleotide-binding universal stress UspA family protein
MRRLVGYDGSPSADRALAHAVALHKPGDELALIGVRSAADRDDGLDRARRTLSTKGIDARVIAEDGDPARTICMVADRDAYDTIVVGRSNPGQAARLLMGSVASRVAAGAACSVVVVV